MQENMIRVVDNLNDVIFEEIIDGPGVEAKVEFAIMAIASVRDDVQVLLDKSPNLKTLNLHEDTLDKLYHLKELILSNPSCITYGVFAEVEIYSFLMVCEPILN